jgi:ATP-dependent Lon protease
MSFDNKIITYQKLEIMESYEHSHSDEFIKYKNWMDTLLNIPFGIYNNIPVNINTSTSQEIGSYILSIRNTLDSQLSFLEKPKDQIINIVTQMIRNPDCNINAIGLHGCKGTGKTSIVESIAKALNRPLRTISLGGESDSSNLTGHNFTYVGSQPGRFIEILKETQTMSPIVLIDEIDKISFTEKGKEIIGTLIHLTDSTTNNKYNIDKYFSGVEFDLSKVLFIFTYNDPDKIDKILSDRLYKIKVDNYSFKEKIEIVNKHLINNILSKLQLSEYISFSQEAIEHLVGQSQKDEGLRTIKTKIKIILTRINMLLLTQKDDNIIKLKYNKLYESYNTLPIVIPKEHVDIFLDESISSELELRPPPFSMYN